MPLTASTNYKNALTSTIQEEWIFELRNNTYTDGSANTQYVRLATALVGSGATQYHSLITSTPSIRENIDLVQSTSKVGNISITCVNGQLSNHSNATLAEEIYGGTRKYINRDVVVKSRVAGGFVDSGYNMGALNNDLTASSSDTTFEIADTSIPEIFSAGVVIKINNEEMLISSVSFTPSISVTINVVRGHNGTTIAAHTAADVYVFSGYENTIYTGRLKSVTLQNQDLVSIEISARTPIDFLKIPEHTSLAGNFFPILYGEGTPETSSVSSPQFVTDARVFPLQVDTLNNNRYNCLAHQAVTGDGRLHYPVKDSFSSDGFPMFVPLDDDQNSSVNKYEGVTDSNKNVLFTDLDLHRGYKLLPTQSITYNAPSQGTVTNFDDFYDTSHTSCATWATGDLPQTTPSTPVAVDFSYLVEDISREEHEIEECLLYVKWGVSDFAEEPQTSLSASLRVRAIFGGSSITHTAASTNGNRADDYTSINLLDTNIFSSANGQAPDSVQIYFEASGSVQSSGDSPGSLTFRACDFYLQIKTKIIDKNDNTDLNSLVNSNAVTGIKKLYTGTDGLDKSWSSGAVTNIAEMHRDLMYRFVGITTSSVFQSDGTTANLLAEALDSSETGVDVDDGSVFAVNDAIRIDNEEMLITSISSNTLTVTRGQNGTSAATHSNNASITRVPENFTTLNTARSGWTVFYYLQKQKELLKILEQTQKEGGFIFRFKASDGNPQYIYLVDSPSTNHTISKSDIKSTKISLTTFDNLITKRVIKHQRNPLNDEMLFEVECTDTTNNPRTDYNVQSDENIATEELKILNGNIVNTQEGKTITSTNMGSGNKNDGYANYYNAIEGNPKLLVDTEIINPGSSGGSHFYLMEVGDICAFDHTDMIVEPFGESFNGKKFIVTSLTRSPGSLKVSLREI